MVSLQFFWSCFPHEKSRKSTISALHCSCESYYFHGFWSIREQKCLQKHFLNDFFKKLFFLAIKNVAYLYVMQYKYQRSILEHRKIAHKTLTRFFGV